MGKVWEYLHGVLTLHEVFHGQQDSESKSQTQSGSRSESSDHISDAVGKPDRPPRPSGLKREQLRVQRFQVGREPPMQLLLRLTDVAL